MRRSAGCSPNDLACLPTASGSGTGGAVATPQGWPPEATPRVRALCQLAGDGHRVRRRHRENSLPVRPSRFVRRPRSGQFPDAIPAWPPVRVRRGAPASSSRWSGRSPAGDTPPQCRPRHRSASSTRPRERGVACVQVVPSPPLHPSRGVASSRGTQGRQVVSLQPSPTRSTGGGMQHVWAVGWHLLVRRRRASRCWTRPQSDPDRPDARPLTSGSHSGVPRPPNRPSGRRTHEKAPAASPLVGGRSTVSTRERARRDSNP